MNPPTPTALHFVKFEGRCWPTETRRPHETVAEWCRRLDSYCNRGLEKT